MPRCAISALSMFRTVCFGVTSAVVSTWISSTAPLSLAMIRAAITPGSVARSSSARLIGRTVPAMGDDKKGDGAGELAGADKRRTPVRRYVVLTGERSPRSASKNDGGGPCASPGGGGWG